MSLTLNPFDLLGDEGDGGRRRKAPAPKPATPAPAPAVAPKPAAPAAPKPSPQQPAAKKAPTAKAAPQSNNTTAKKENGTARPKPQGGEGQRGPRPERRAPQQAGGAPPAPRAAGTPGDEGAPHQGRPASNWSGERRERAPGRGRKFDRRSGTGRNPTENKKAGSGKANWGKAGEAVEELPKENGEAEKEETEKPAAEGEVAPAEGEPETPQEPEKVLKGLDEYFAELKAKAAKVEAPKPRAAGEGVDQSAWKEYVPLSKDDNGEDGPIKNKKKEVAQKDAPSTGAPEIELGFRLAPPQGIEERGGGRRGGRGGDRGDRGRGDRKGRGGGRGGRGGNRGGRGGAPSSSDAGASTAPAFAADDFPVLTPAAPKPAAVPAPVKA